MRLSQMVSLLRRRGKQEADHSGLSSAMPCTFICHSLPSMNRANVHFSPSSRDQPEIALLPALTTLPQTELLAAAHRDV
jgi:hypothetical protein